MRSPLVTETGLFERRDCQRLSLLRYSLLRNSATANKARDATAQAGQTIFHTELTPREEAELVMRTNWIKDDLKIEREKFPKELDSQGRQFGPASGHHEYADAKPVSQLSTNNPTVSTYFWRSKRSRYAQGPESVSAVSVLTSR